MSGITSLPQATGQVPNRRAILLRAAKIVEERGWTRGVKGIPSKQRRYGLPENAPVCILGAIAASLETKGHWMDTEESYEKAAAVIAPDTSAVSYWDWNDTTLRHSDAEVGARRVARTLRLLAKGIPWSQAREK